MKKMNGIVHNGWDEAFWINKNGEVFSLDEDDEHYQVILGYSEFFGIDFDYLEATCLSNGYESVSDAEDSEYDDNLADEIIGNAIEAGNLRIRITPLCGANDVGITCYSVDRDKDLIINFLLDNKDVLNSPNYDFGIYETHGRGGFSSDNAVSGDFMKVINELLKPMLG